MGLSGRTRPGAPVTEQLEDVVTQAHYDPLGVDGIDATHGELAESPSMLDLAVDGLDHGLAPRVDRQATRRLRQWLSRKHKVGSENFVQFPDKRLWKEYDHIYFSPRTASFPWAKGMISSESQMRENRLSDSMSGNWKRDYGSRTEARSESDGRATGP